MTDKKQQLAKDEYWCEHISGNTEKSLHTEKGSCGAKDRDKPHSSLLNDVAVSKKCRPSEICKDKKIFLVSSENMSKEGYPLEMTELTPALEDEIKRKVYSNIDDTRDRVQAGLIMAIVFRELRKVGSAEK